MAGPATTLPPTGARSEIPGLLGLRAVMGTWVVADHLHDWMITLLPALAPLRPLLSGGIALDTFFIMSGFVIAHVYARGLSSGDRRSYGAFLWARVARLWPTHVFALGVTAVVIAAFAAVGSTYSPLRFSIGTFIGNVAMLQAFPGGDAWNYPSWSVCVEMISYLLFPVVAVVVARARRGAAVALATAVVAVQAIVLPHLYAESLTAGLVGAVWVRPVGEIVLGCALWAAWRHGIPRHWCWDLVALGALTGVVLIAYLAPSFGPVRVLTMALLGTVVVAVTGATGLVHRLLELRPIRWAGRTSYSRYLVHWPVIMTSQLLVPTNNAVTAPASVRVATVVSWFAIVFVAGGLTYRFVEEPARRRLRALGARRRTHGVPVEATATVPLPTPNACR